jgi:Tol biopolymer transport system component
MEAAKRGRNLPWSVSAIALIVGAIAGLLISTRLPLHPPESSSAEPVIRTALPMGPEERLAASRRHEIGLGLPAIALSPDGSSLAYVVVHDGSSRIHVRRLDETRSAPLPGTDGGFGPFFSPDGAWVGFFADDKLKKVALHGGEPVVLCDAVNPAGASWAQDGRIAFTSQEGANLLSVSDRGGNVETIALSHEMAWFFWPQVVGKWRAVLVTIALEVSENPDYWTLAAVIPETGEIRRIHEGGAFARYLPTGHLLFVRGMTLQAASFDLEGLSLEGEPVTVLEGVRTEANGSVHMSYSRSGLGAYVPGPKMGVSEFVWVRPGGDVEPVGLPAGFYGTFHLSPDGRRLAAVVNEASREIWIFDLQRGAFRRLVGNGGWPVWSPDGHEIFFSSSNQGQNSVYRTRADGSTEPTKVEVASTSDLLPGCWSPDGDTLVFQGGAQQDILLLDHATSEVRPFVATDASEWGPAISPDGKWIAYTSDSSGRFEVYVQSFPDGGKTWTVSSGSGEEPYWSKEGDRLFYRNGDELMAVEISYTPEFSPGRPRVVVEGPYINVPWLSYNVHPDGERFLLLRTFAEDIPQPIPHLIINWFDELKRLVPTD